MFIIEILKELSVILKDLPDLAVWVLAGLLLYKVVFIGSIFGLIKLAINKLHDYFVRPKEVINKIEFDDVVYSHDGGISELKDFIRKVKRDNNGFKLSKLEVQFIAEAYEEKLSSIDGYHNLKRNRK